MALAGLFDTLQPAGIQAVQGISQQQQHGLALAGSKRIRLFDQLFPDRQQPLGRLRRRATQQLQTLRCGQGNRRDAALLRIQRTPVLLQLRHILGRAQPVSRQLLDQGLAGQFRKRLVSYQHARRFERLMRITDLLGGTQAITQGRHAATGSLWQLVQLLQCLVRLVAVERPAYRSQQQAFACFGGGRPLDLLPLLLGTELTGIAPVGILHALAAVCHQAVRQRAQLHAVGRGHCVWRRFPARYDGFRRLYLIRLAIQAFILLQCLAGSRAGTAITTGHLEGHGIEQMTMHGTLLLVRTPALGLLRQTGQDLHAAQQCKAQQEQPDNNGNDQVEREVNRAGR